MIELNIIILIMTDNERIQVANYRKNKIIHNDKSNEVYKK